MSAGNDWRVDDARLEIALQLVEPRRDLRVEESELEHSQSPPNRAGLGILEQVGQMGFVLALEGRGGFQCHVFIARGGHSGLADRVGVPELEDGGLDGVARSFLGGPEQTGGDGQVALAFELDQVLTWIESHLESFAELGGGG